MQQHSVLHIVWNFITQASEHEIRFVDSVYSDHRNSKIFDAALKFGNEIKWLSIKKNSYSLTERGAEISKKSHWRFIKPTEHEIHTLKRNGFEIHFIDEELYKTRPKIIDLFAGVGGLTYGYESAGFNVVASIDNDPQACEAHKKNFPDTVVIQEDINAISNDPKAILKKYNISTDIDGVIGGPPCQGFSYIGERVITDDRNFLTTRFTDVVNKLEPKFFMMENVAGLQTIGIRPEFKSFLLDLAKPIGAAATDLSESLQDFPKSVAKRSRQFKKRLISKTITIYKELIFDEFGDKFLNSLNFSTTSIFYKLFTRAFDQACADLSPDLCDDAKWIKSAHVMVTQHIDSHLKITIGTLAEKCISKHSNSDYEFFIDRLISGMHGQAFSSVAKLLLAAYNEQPTAARYNGEKVGPVLMGIIKRVEKKYKIYGPKVLNAYQYGAPQSRKRLFLIGIRRDIDSKYSFPEITHHLPHKVLDGLISAPTCEDALSDLPDVDNFAHLIQSDKLESTKLQKIDCEYSSQMRLLKLDSSNLSLPRLDWNPFVVDCCTRTIHSEEVLDRLSNTAQGIQDKKSGKTRLNRYGVSNTLRAGTKEEKGSHTAVRPVHYEFHRVVTVREGARLMGFPDWMTFHPTKWHGFRLVGNAVPYQLGSAVAKSIISIL